MVKCPNVLDKLVENIKQPTQYKISKSGIRMDLPPVELEIELVKVGAVISQANHLLTTAPDNEKKTNKKTFYKCKGRTEILIWVLTNSLPYAGFTTLTIYHCALRGPLHLRPNWSPVKGKNLKSYSARLSGGCPSEESYVLTILRKEMIWRNVFF
jgi:hypothetical protein